MRVFRSCGARYQKWGPLPKVHMAKNQGATMIPLVMNTFGKLGPYAESYLKSLADVACSTGFVHRGFLVTCC